MTDDIPRITPLNFRIDGPDNTGQTVRRIYAQSSDFVVFRNDYSIRIDINLSSKNFDTLFKGHGRIALLLAQIHSLLPEKLDRSEAINRQIGRAIRENALDNGTVATELLGHALLRLRNQKTIKGRLHYTLSSLCVVGIVLLLTTVLSLCCTTPTNATLSLYYRFAKIAFCGSLGGLLSVSLGFPRLHIDLDSDAITNSMIGATRVLISIAAALFGYFAIQSGIALSVFHSQGNHGYGIYVMAMLAGFSEMLIPNLMSNLSAGVTGPQPIATNSQTEHQSNSSILQPALVADAQKNKSQ